MTGASDPSSWTLPRLRITRDATWLSESEEVTHAGILAALWDGLRVDADGHYLPIGPVRVPVEVEDTPFVVLRVEGDPDRLMLTLSDLSREPLSPDTLRFDRSGVPYCRVRDGRFDARLSRAAAYQLLQHVEAGAPGHSPVLVIGAARHPLPGLGDNAPADSV